MYVARFELDAGEYQVAAADLECQPGSSLVPSPWADALLDFNGCDFAVRLNFSGEAVQGRLLVSDRSASPAVEKVLERIQSAPRSGESVRIASSAEEFDSLVSAISPHQVWLNQHGYRVRNQPVAADFQLLPLLERLLAVLGDSGRELTYQINLRRHRSDQEEERVVRKYIAGLRLEPPFPMPITNLQASISNRLLHAGFLSDEMLAAGDGETLDLVLEEIRNHFDSTMGKFGFETPPVEAGQFDDLFLSGLHSSCFGEDADFLCDGAGAYPAEDLRRFLCSPVPVSPAAMASASAASSPSTLGGAPVFLSYASKDYIQALATSRHLESQGIGCWIAPRNILPGEAYPDAIMRAINACRAMVVLLSESSNLSPHVQREIDRALSRNAVIIPLRLQEIEPSGSMEYLLSTCQWIDGFGQRFDPALGELRDRLRGLRISGAT